MWAFIIFPLLQFNCIDIVPGCRWLSRVTSWTGNRSGLAGSNPSHTAGLDPAQSIFAKGVFGKTHPYVMAIIFMPILVWYLAKPFWYQKNPKIFGHLRWFVFWPLALCFFFFFVFCIFSAMCLICGSLLLNAKSIVQRFFYFNLKMAKKNKYNKG